MIPVCVVNTDPPDPAFLHRTGKENAVRQDQSELAVIGFSRADLYGKNDHDFFPGDEADFFTRNDRRVLENRQLADILEEKVQTRLRGEHILHTRKIPIPDENPISDLT